MAEDDGARLWLLMRSGYESSKILWISFQGKRPGVTQIIILTVDFIECIRKSDHLSFEHDVHYLLRRSFKVLGSGILGQP